MTDQERPRPRLASEREYQQTIVRCAKDWGWRVMHTRPAIGRYGRYHVPIQGDPGFPDLVLVHRDVGVFFRELKVTTILTDDQTLWAQALLAAGADWRELRMPRDLDETCQWLYDAPRRATGMDAE